MTSYRNKQSKAISKKASKFDGDTKAAPPMITNSTDETQKEPEPWADMLAFLRFAVTKYEIPIRLCFYRIEENADTSKRSHFPLEETDLSLSSLLDTVPIGIKFDEETKKPTRIIFEESVPRTIFKAIGLVIPYHPQLYSIVLRGRGHRQYAIYEISKILPASNLTDLQFDGADIPNGQYHWLLDSANSLKSLSLARCSIRDDIAREIAKRLCYGQPAAQRLQVLNLSSNFITDDGALKIAEMLKTNRTLSYLNLSNNQITDLGAKAILYMLTCFKISPEEFVKVRRLHLAYLIQRQIAAKAYFEILKAKSGESTSVTPKKTSQPPTPTKKTGQKIPKSGISSSALTFEKAESLMKYPEFLHPLYSEAIKLSSGGAIIRGNGTLARLNLSYNRLTEFTLTLAINIMKSVIEGQRNIFLINFEGTMLPVESDLQTEAEKLLEMQLLMFCPSKQTPKRKKNPNPISHY